MRKYKNNINFNVRNITLNYKNIILFLKNLNAHLTEKIKIIILSLSTSILSLANIINTFTYTSNTSASDYSSNVGVGFTFNPTLSISLSSSDLVIDNLIPGSMEDSNSINVSVATNAVYGYTLSANVNNKNLVHDNNTNTFSSIATNASLETLTTDNTWGYSYKLSNDSNIWSNYSGLSTDATKTLVNTDNQTSKPIDFKIAAKASPTQPSGIYTGTINFIAISKSIPRTIEDIAYMQTFGELNPTDLQSVKDSMLQEHTYTLKDARDEQEYTIAKLKDGKIWMTKNLNLAGGTEITAELSDVPANYTLPTTNGFQEGNRLPESSQTGFSDNTQAYVYNTGNSTDNCANPGCYSYYSWHAATAGSGVNITANNTDAPYSICPKGWKLPNTRSGIDAVSDFRALMISLGGNEEISVYNTQTNPTGSTLLSYLTAPPFNLLFSASYEASDYTARSLGFYWSSTSGNNFSARALSIEYFYKVTAAGGWDNRKDGYSIRCLAR